MRHEESLLQATPQASSLKPTFLQPLPGANQSSLDNHHRAVCVFDHLGRTGTQKNLPKAFGVRRDDNQIRFDLF